MNEFTIAALAFESWYALPQRDRTIARLESAVDNYAASYWGQGPHSGTLGDTIGRAYELARGKVRPWHCAPDTIDQITRG